MIKDILNDAESRMKGAIQALRDDLSRIRTGRATPALIDNLQVEYYGAPTPLMQLATISVPEPRQLMIKPFDRNSIKDIERAIMASDLGLNPNNDGQSIRLNLPVLTEERRRDLGKVVHNRAEEARVAIRNVRRDLMKDLKEAENEKMVSEDERKRGEESLQKITDRYIGEVDQSAQAKEKEILEI